MIYITSDLHFGHDKNFMYEPRGFASAEEHDAALIENWNNLITAEDDVYVLGDLMLGDNAAGAEKIAQLNGKLHIVRGNHDTDARMEVYNTIPNIVEICGWSTMIKWHKYRFYLSHYPCLVSNFDEDKPLIARVINLCGHSHADDPFKDWDKGIIYHVEMDAHNMTPISIEQIRENIKEKIEECKKM